MKFTLPIIALSALLMKIQAADSEVSASPSYSVYDCPSVSVTTSYAGITTQSYNQNNVWTTAVLSKYVVTSFFDTCNHDWSTPSVPTIYSTVD